MSLRERLAAEIAATGPISVAQYMTRCLHDPQDGYYATRPALGPEGDFLTAPLVSQMFGELIGLWMVETWRRLGEPSPFRLVEMGPGDGTLMSDLLRATARAPGFQTAAEVWLVETSAPLAARQRERLAGQAVRWAHRLEDVPGGAPLLLVANELLDCLPARQFVRVGERWIERLVGVDEAGNLAFGLAEPPPSPFVGRDRPRSGQGGGTADSPQVPHPSRFAIHPPHKGEGDLILEISDAQEALGALLGERIAVDGGAALLIDYGRHEPGFGDTLQALRRHEKVDPLASPGEADLTVHADFPTVLKAAEEAGAAATVAMPQGLFLLRLGVGARLQALQAARPDRADVLDRQYERLVSPEQMGELFRAAVIHQPGLVPPAFEAEA